ncbi:MAG: hypothetical protein ACUVSY_13570 [Roseiflexus sp.]
MRQQTCAGAEKRNVASVLCCISEMRDGCPAVADSGEHFLQYTILQPSRVYHTGYDSDTISITIAGL